MHAHVRLAPHQLMDLPGAQSLSAECESASEATHRTHGPARPCGGSND